MGNYIQTLQGLVDREYDAQATQALDVWRGAGGH
jgi:hypothetical protein